MEKILPKRKDYIYFIAGTTASFWFEKEGIGKAIIDKIKDYKSIKILDKSTASKYDIRLSRKYGELILYLEKGD